MARKSELAYFCRRASLTAPPPRSISADNIISQREQGLDGQPVSRDETEPRIDRERERKGRSEAIYQRGASKQAERSPLHVCQERHHYTDERAEGMLCPINSDCLRLALMPPACLWIKVMLTKRRREKELPASPLSASVLSAPAWPCPTLASRLS